MGTRRQKAEGRRQGRSFVAYCLLLSASCFLLSSCGYTATRILPAYYRTIYVEPFENKIPIAEDVTERIGFATNYPEIEEKVTRGVINQFLFDGNLRITNKPENADLMLTGAIVDFYRQPIRRNADDTVEEYRLNLSASVTLRDKAGKLLLQDSAMVGDTTFFLTGPSARSEGTAVEDLVTDFSHRVVEWVSEHG